jgi:hypothetical protein
LSKTCRGDMGDYVKHSSSTAPTVAKCCASTARTWINDADHPVWRF